MTEALLAPPSDNAARAQKSTSAFRTISEVADELDVPITHLLLESARPRDEGYSEPAP